MNWVVFIWYELIMGIFSLFQVWDHKFHMLKIHSFLFSGFFE